MQCVGLTKKEKRSDIEGGQEKRRERAGALDVVQ